MGKELLSRGIYAILNKELNLVYIGETQRNFLIRWIEHLNRIHTKFENFDRTQLFLHKNTKFIILKKMDQATFQRKEFYTYEQEAYEFYKRKGWGVVSVHYFNPTSDYENHEANIEKLMERYRIAIQHMAVCIATINTNHQNGSIILKRLYTQLERKFNTDTSKVKGQSVINRLTKEELEFMLLELYPRFFHKKLELVRKEFKAFERQLSMSDLNTFRKGIANGE